MELLVKFMNYCYQLGIAVQMKPYKPGGTDMNLPNLRLSFQGKHFDRVFHDFEDMSMWLETGGGTRIARELCIPEFEVKDAPKSD